MSLMCPICEIPLDTEGGWKRHMTRKLGEWSNEQLITAGGAPSGKDIARSLDGHTSIDSVIADAPETENAGKQDKAKVRKAEKEREQDLAEFRRLRPQLIARWKRRLRIPYSMWARLADDPQIRLTDEELTEGAELHVDFCEAMGWLKAGKVEAILDLTMWHGGTIMSRSKIGQSLLESFKDKTNEDQQNTM